MVPLDPIAGATGGGWVIGVQTEGAVYATTEVHLAGVAPDTDYTVWRLIDSSNRADACESFFANWTLPVAGLHTTRAGTATAHTALADAVVPPWMHGIIVGQKLIVRDAHGVVAYASPCITYVMH